MLTDQRGFVPPRSPSDAEATAGEPAADPAAFVTAKSCSKRSEPGPRISRTARMNATFP